MTSREREFELLVRACSTDLFRFAWWLSGDRSRAEDLVQETLLRAWRALHQLRDPRQARSWLLTTLRREHARGFENRAPSSFEDVDGIADQLPAPDALEAGLERGELLARMRVLPASYREAIVLQVLFGYTQDEIARILDVTPATANNWLFRARRALVAGASAAPPSLQSRP